jgi:hypothetical protein
MKRKLKIAATMITLWGSFLACPAQQSNTVTFNYDSNGNRIGQAFTSGVGRANETAMSDNNSASTILDSFKAMKVNIYPNPTHDKVFLSIENIAKTLVHAKLVTETGATLWESNITGDVESIDLSGQAAGVFLLELTVERERRIWKVIKK